MELEKSVKEKLESEEFGIFEVLLQEGFVFEWYTLEHENGMPKVSGSMTTRERNEISPLSERVALGAYRRKEQLSEKGFEMDIIGRLRIFIPYNAIFSYKRLSDLSF